MSGGAALPVEILRGFEEAFGCIILEGYGLSETSPVASFNHPDRERKPGSIGTPIEGVEFRLVDDDLADVPEGEVGEIAIKGHNVMKGYWNRPEATAAAIHDGWFRTGDLARRDEDGYYFIVDRKKDMIIRGGFNVYPREIEEVLYEHPAVAEAAVIGVPHPTHGEEVAAAVQLCPAPRPPPTSCATSSRSGWPRTSTPGTCGSSTRCRRARPARSSNGRSSRRPSWVGVDDGRRRSEPRGRALFGGNSAIAATSTTGPAPAPSRSTCFWRTRRWAPTGGSSPAWPVSSSALGWYARPDVVPRRGWGLASELGRIVVGTSQVQPSPRDRRFADPAWSENPLLRRLAQAYIAASTTAEALVDDADLDWASAQRIDFITENLIEALSPSNSPLTNPQALKAAVDTGGAELPARCCELHQRHVGATADTRMVDRTPYRVGENIATTPGAVVLRTEMFELIQYRPQTPTVLSSHCSSSHR